VQDSLKRDSNSLFVFQTATAAIYVKKVLTFMSLFKFGVTGGDGGSSDNKRKGKEESADRSSIFFLKVKGLSFSITKEGGVE
ncbi:hypothetical protein DPMN_049284, partial [Dreissena polymorpha]